MANTREFTLPESASSIRSPSATLSAKYRPFRQPYRVSASSAPRTPSPSASLPNATWTQFDMHPSSAKRISISRACSLLTLNGMLVDTSVSACSGTAPGGTSITVALAVQQKKATRWPRRPHNVRRTLRYMVGYLFIILITHFQ